MSKLTEGEAGVLPGQKEGCSHSNTRSKGHDVGDNQVALKTHHQDHEGNHRLEGTGTLQVTNARVHDLSVRFVNQLKGLLKIYKHRKTVCTARYISKDLILMHH